MVAKPHNVAGTLMRWDVIVAYLKAVRAGRPLPPRAGAVGLTDGQIGAYRQTV